MYKTTYKMPKIIKKQQTVIGCMCKGPGQVGVGKVQNSSGFTNCACLCS